MQAARLPLQQTLVLIRVHSWLEKQKNSRGFPAGRFEFN
jgi:hypothetical protein